MIREGFLKERIFLRKKIFFFRKSIKYYILSYERKNKYFFSIQTWLDKVIREGFLKERVFFLRKMINFFRKKIKDYIRN